MENKQLEQYLDKRDFKQTKEPEGLTNESYDDTIFVIQKHDAQNLHYDFRLEMDGILKSWAVPKGPSLDPSVKRLAIETEDHPLAYADFEGVIPEDNYGAGEIIVWDKGTYKNVSYKEDTLQPLKEAYHSGKIVVSLSGEKLSGNFALIRMNKKKSQWLLIKEDDDKADARRNPTSTENKSVMSGVTINDLKHKS